MDFFSIDSFGTVTIPSSIATSKLVTIYNALKTFDLSDTDPADFAFTHSLVLALEAEIMDRMGW